MTFAPARRQALQLAAAALGAATFALAGAAHAREDASGSLRSGTVFASSNAPGGNELLVYAADHDGAAAPVERLPTGGTGTGAGLGSQGAVTLSRNGRYLFVVNAGSHTLSTFELKGGAPALTSVVDSGGLMPTSVTENDGRVFVLNAAGSGNVTGFRNERGRLTRIAGAVGTLSAATGTAPAQVGFSDDGEVLVVSERNTNRLTSFLVGSDGTLAHKTVSASAGAVPFGFAFTQRDRLLVTEAAASAVSSYRFMDGSATPELVTASLPDTQAAACWIAVTPNGRFAFAANAATSNLSSFAIAHDGTLTLLAGVAGSTGANAGALDLALNASGTRLHVLANRAAQIATFAVGADGTLTPLGALGGLPAGAAGLAAN